MIVVVYKSDMWKARLSNSADHPPQVIVIVMVVIIHINNNDNNNNNSSKSNMMQIQLIIITQVVESQRVAIAELKLECGEDLPSKTTR